MRKHLFLLLAPMLAIPSLYSLAQALSIPAILATLLLNSAVLYTILHSNWLKPILNTPWPTSLLVATLAISNVFNHQPIPTFLPSGWNTLLQPLLAFGLIPLLTPLTLAFTVWVMRTTNHPWLQINRFALALFTCVLMWPNAAADLPAIGLLILSLTLLLTRQRILWPELAACILLLAAAATSRAILIYLPLLMGFSLFAVWPKRGLTVALAGTAFSLLLNPTLPIIPSFDPMTFDPLILAPAILLTIVIIQSIYHWRWWPAPQHAAWGLGAPLMVIALSNLSETTSFALWYGAIYLTPALPVVTYTLLRPTYKNR